jgi:hypothetical protein
MADSAVTTASRSIASLQARSTARSRAEIRLSRAAMTWRLRLP